MVIHGTDTMAFAASVLSFVLENLQKTVILTGAQVPQGAVGQAFLRPRGCCGPRRVPAAHSVLQLLPWDRGAGPAVVGHRVGGQEARREFSQCRDPQGEQRGWGGRGRCHQQGLFSWAGPAGPSPTSLSLPQPPSLPDLSSAVASPRCPSTRCGTTAGRTCWGPCSWPAST